MQELRQCQFWLPKYITFGTRKTFFDFLLFSVDGGIKKQILGQDDHC